MLKDFGSLQCLRDLLMQLLLRLQLDRLYLLMSRAFSPSILDHIDCKGDSLGFELRTKPIKGKLSFPTYKTNDINFNITILQLIHDKKGDYRAI